MTKIKIDKKDDRVVIKAKGHATGSEQVCSAISTLIYSLEAWIANNPDCIKKHFCELDEGEAFISFIPVESESYTALEFFVVGLVNIAKSYEEYVTVSVSSEISHLLRTRN